jgi:hypothetical protein
MKKTLNVFKGIRRITAIRRMAIIAMFAVIGFSMTACEDISDGNEGGGSGGGGDGNNGSGYWVISKTTTYTVANGEVGSISSETKRNWITYRYKNETKYKKKYTEGSTTYYSYRNGQTYVSTTETSAGTSTQTTLYDLETGLALQVTVTDYSGTTTEAFYTIQLLSDTGGIKTYKHYVTSTGGTGPYTEYKFQNGKKVEEILYNLSVGGVVLNSTFKYTYTNNTTQTSYYDANDVLFYIQTLTITNISGKVNWYLYNTDYPSLPAYNYFETVEVLSDSSSELVFRRKRFNGSNVLTAQTDYLLKRF